MRTATAMVLFVLVQGLVACDGRGASGLAGPSSTAGPAPPLAPTSATTLRVFTEAASGFSTSDVRDAQAQIVQFNTADELIWTADGTRFPGFTGSGIFINADALCGCVFEVRFGTESGERRAYLTADYGHENPGTLVDLDVVSGTLAASRSTVGPPGSYTLSGVVTALTPAGVTPVESVRVARDYSSGWQGTTTDQNGFYEIPGLYDGIHIVLAWKDGYQGEAKTLSISGDMRVDFELVGR